MIFGGAPLTPEQSQEAAKTYLAVIGGLGRWFVAALVLVNAGALAAVLQSPFAVLVLPNAGVLFVAGVATALLGGAFAITWTLGAYSLYATPAMQDTASDAKFRMECRRQMRSSWNGALICFTASLCCFVLGCFWAGSQLANPPVDVQAPRHANAPPSR